MVLFRVFVMNGLYYVPYLRKNRGTFYCTKLKWIDVVCRIRPARANRGAAHVCSGYSTLRMALLRLNITISEQLLRRLELLMHRRRSRVKRCDCTETRPTPPVSCFMSGKIAVSRWVANYQRVLRFDWFKYFFFLNFYQLGSSLRYQIKSKVE